MAVTVKVKQKEEMNELLGSLLAWGAIAFLIGKLLGFKFNLESDEQMTKWGVQLGDAFKFSRQKLKNSSIPNDQRARIDNILTTADQRIRRAVQLESERLRGGGARSTDIDHTIERHCNDAVASITAIIKDRRHAEEFVAPLRATFDELTSGLDSTRRAAALGALRRDTGLVDAIRAALSTPGGPPATAIAIDAALDRIAEGVARSMGTRPTP